MKTTTFIAALGLSTFAAAQPHRARHLDKHVKRDDVVVTVVNTVYAMATEAPEVVVVVNQFGSAVSTYTEGNINAPLSIWSSEIASTPSSSSSSSTSTSSTSSAYVAPAPSSISIEASPVLATQISSSSTPAYTAPVASTSEEASAMISAVSTSSSSSSSSTSSESGGFGFSYSPYNSDGSCKTQDQVNTDFDAIPGGYSLVRTYGTDCNQVATVKTAAKAKGLKMFVGVFDLGSLHEECSTIASAMSDDWDMIDTINIGNELVNDGTASASEVVAALTIGRGLLKLAGYNGKVVTVDTLVAARNNPSIMDASDYAAVNCHPFFNDGLTVASDSGSFLTSQIPSLRAVLANQNQDIVITESGWPSAGETNGVSVPSKDNQNDAINSIKAAFSSNPAGVILFTAFNDMWKTNTAAQFQAEQYWGFLGGSPSG